MCIYIVLKWCDYWLVVYGEGFWCKRVYGIIEGNIIVIVNEEFIVWSIKEIYVIIEGKWFKCVKYDSVWWIVVVIIYC